MVQLISRNFKHYALQPGHLKWFKFRAASNLIVVFLNKIEPVCCPNFDLNKMTRLKGVTLVGSSTKRNHAIDGKILNNCCLHPFVCSRFKSI